MLMLETHKTKCKIYPREGDRIKLKTWPQLKSQC